MGACRGERSLRPPAVRRRPGPHLRPGPAGAPRRRQAHPLDVVRLPAGRGAGPQRDGAALRDLRTAGSPRLPLPPGARPPSRRVRPRAHRPRHRRPGRGVRTGRRPEAAVVDDAVRPRRPRRAGVPRGARPLLRRRRGRRDDQPALDRDKLPGRSGHRSLSGGTPPFVASSASTQRASRCPDDRRGPDPSRTAELTKHADLMARVLLQHHATERELLWPALFRSLPIAVQDAAREPIGDWTHRTALLDHTLRDLSTHARQWAVAPTEPSRAAFARACGRVAEAVEAAQAAEERDLLPLLHRLPDSEWAAVSRAARCTLSGREQMLVLGLALEDACAIDRARLLAGLPSTVRTAWRVVGRRNFRTAVVRLRGAPPAA